MLSNSEHEELLGRARQYLSDVQAGYPQQSVIYYGYSGVGKTELLNNIEVIADNMGILHRHIKADKNGKFFTPLMSAINGFIQDIEIENVSSYFNCVLFEDLTEILVALGKSALKANDTICFFIDDIQYVCPKEINELMASIHRCNQLRLPVMFFCAGRPEILGVVGNARPYSERCSGLRRLSATFNEKRCY